MDLRVNFFTGATPLFEAIAIIPIAILGGLAPIPVFILALAGNLLTVFLVIIFIDQIKQWRNRRKQQKEAANAEKAEKREKRARQIWQKYGLPGLALVGPLIVGSHITAFMSLVLGGTKNRVAFWITVSLLLWGTVFGVLAYFGLDLLNIENPILERYLTEQ